MNSQTLVEPLTEHEVLTAAEELIAAFSRTDTQAYFAAFAPDATFVFHSEEQRLENRSAYEELWQGWLEQGWSIAGCESTDARVQLCGTSAIFSHSVKTTTRTGGLLETTHERETIVFSRRGDGDGARILAVHEHLSDHPSAAGTAVAGDTLTAGAAGTAE